MQVPFIGVRIVIDKNNLLLMLLLLLLLGFVSMSSIFQKLKTDLQ